MPRINRSEFIEDRRSQRVDLTAAKNDPAFLAKLHAAGFKLEDLEKLDLADHDGMLEGPRELRALFDQLKRLEGGGPAEVLTVKPRGWTPDAARGERSTKADTAYDAFESHFQPSPRAPAPAAPIDGAARARFPLSGPVGAGGRNLAADVRLVQQRLKDVGFDLGVDGQWGRKSETALKTYRAMLTGAEYTKEEPGLIAPNDLVDRALSSEAPPRWEKMPASGPGFVNHDTDGFSHGSAEMRLAIEEFSLAYARDYLAVNPGKALISLNDASESHGGDNRDHDTHENGLDLDLRLPRKDGTSGSDVRRTDYDREAAWAMLSSIAANPRVERVLFSDATLLERAKTERQPWAFKVFDGGDVHRNHFHVDIKPPR